MATTAQNEAPAQGHPCKVCGKVYPTGRKLGGHVRYAHSKKPLSAAPVQESAQSPAEEPQHQAEQEPAQRTEAQHKELAPAPAPPLPPPTPRPPMAPPSTAEPTPQMKQWIEAQIIDPAYKAPHQQAPSNPYGNPYQGRPQQPQQSAPQEGPNPLAALLQAAMPLISKVIETKFVAPPAPSIWEDIGKASYAQFMGSFAKSHGTALGKEKAKTRARPDNQEEEEPDPLAGIIMGKFEDITKRQQQENADLKSKIEILENALRTPKPQAAQPEPPAPQVVDTTAEIKQEQAVENENLVQEPQQEQQDEGNEHK